MITVTWQLDLLTYIALITVAVLLSAGSIISIVRMAIKIISDYKRNKSVFKE